MKQHAMLASFALIAVGCAAAGAIAEKSSASGANSVSTIHEAWQQTPPAAGQSAPPTRAEIIKDGPTALEQNCTKCHGPDKWEGTSRDHDGWAAIVATMQTQMAQAQMPPMNDRTTNLIVGYLTLTHPQ
jgi:mono/diheme cytochrome c family protein